MKKMSSALILVMLFCSCSSVNIRTDEQREENRPPTFQKRYVFWWWGLKGEHSVNVREICLDKPVMQMQTVDTFTDVLYGVFTLGIYAPRTARVWCGGETE